MNGIVKMETARAMSMRAVAYAIALGVALLATACGGDTAPTGNASQYPTGIASDIEKQLKYDARVQDFKANGDTLIVTVNDAWMSSPPGMRARALGQWYSLWQPSHGAGSKIVVEHQGNEVETWTAEKGYQPASKEKEESDAG